MTIILDGTAGITTPAETTTGNESVGGNLSVTGTVSVGGSTMYPLVSGTAVASTSGTSLDFLSIPAWVKRITVMFSGVSTSGTSVPIIQLGTSSGAETTGYTSGTGVIQLSTATQNTTITSGIAIAVSGYFTAASTFTGAVTFSLLGSNAWIASGNITREGGGTTVFFTVGSKTTAATLDRVRITTVNGTDTFDAGTVNLLWE